MEKFVPCVFILWALLWTNVRGEETICRLLKAAHMYSGYDNCATLVLNPKESNWMECFSNGVFMIDTNSEDLNVAFSKLKHLSECGVILAKAPSQSAIEIIETLGNLFRHRLVILDEMHDLNISFPVTTHRNILNGDIALSSTCEESPSTLLKADGTLLTETWPTCGDDLQGRVLKVNYIGSKPYIIYGREPSGLDIELVKMFGARKGFQPVFIPTNAWGSPNPETGEWNGMVKGIIDGDVEIGVGFPTINAERYEVLDFTYMVYKLDYAFVTGQPNAVPAYTNIITPFNSLTWLCVFLAFAAITLTYFMLFKAATGKASFYGVILPFAILMNQCLNAQTSYPSRPLYIAVLSWLLASMVIIPSYKGLLLATLMEVKYEEPVETSQDILDRDMTFFSPTGSFLLDSLRDSPLDSHRQVYHRSFIKNKGLFVRNHIALPENVEKSILEGRGAIAGYRWVFGPEYHLSREVILSSQVGYMVPKNVAWLADFDFLIQSLKEGGIIDKIIDNIVRELQLEPAKRETEVKNVALTLDHLLASFLMFSVGILMSVVAFALEAFTSRLGTKKPSKK